MPVTSLGQVNYEGIIAVVRVVPESILIGWVVLCAGIIASVFAVLCMALKFWSNHGGFGAGVCVGLCLLVLAYWLIIQGMTILFVSACAPAHLDSRPVAMCHYATFEEGAAL
jgi:hypothetical protein